MLALNPPLRIQVTIVKNALATALNAMMKEFARNANPTFTSMKTPPNALDALIPELLKVRLVKPAEFPLAKLARKATIKSANFAAQTLFFTTTVARLLVPKVTSEMADVASTAEIAV